MHGNNRIFVCADLHLGHKKIIGAAPGFRDFVDIEAHDRFITTVWNGTVRSKDIVIVLGDVAFGEPENLQKLEQLKGLKKLVMGNHDQRSIRRYEPFFTKILGSLVIDGVILTHIPIHPSCLERWRGNIHGHLHELAFADHRYQCVSLERIDYRPIELAEVIARMPEKVKNEYPQD